MPTTPFAVFAATSAAAGQELWVTDGSGLGTQLLLDTDPGPSGSQFSSITAIGLGSAMFLTWDNGTRKLWVTDGTSAGTQQVGPSWTGNLYGGQLSLVSMGNGNVLFQGYTDAAGLELWVSNGTSAGTQLVLDGRAGSNGLNPGLLTTLGNGRIAFRGDETDFSNTELWLSDGTAAGTVKVNINAAAGSNPEDLLADGRGGAFFSANNGINGRELWYTDGTAAGTRMVRDIGNPLSIGPSNLTLISPGKILFFMDTDTTGREPWVSDGTSAGTVMLRDVNPGINGALLGPTGSASLKPGLAVFAGNTPGEGAGIWITDGTVAGTIRIKTTNADYNTYSLPYGLTSLGNGRVVFMTDDGVAGSELWASDGTAAGTIRIADMTAGAAGSNVTAIKSIGAGVALVTLQTGGGEQVWRTDGTAAGTFRALGNGAPGTTDLGGLAVLGNPEVLLTNTAMSNGPVITDGNADGTLALSPTTGSGATQLGFIDLGNGKAVFRSLNAPSTTGLKLSVTDGTVAGTAVISDVQPYRTGGLAVYDYVNGGIAMGDGRALFLGYDATNGAELWVTNGTATGTALVRDINVGIGHGTPHGFAKLADGKFLFWATTAANGTEPWITDGTSAGTMLVRDIAVGTGRSNNWNVDTFTSIGNGRAVFAAGDGLVSNTVWVTDGTTAGTTRLNGLSIWDPVDFFAIGGGRAVFSAVSTASGRELFITDGTAGGTVLLKDIHPTNASLTFGGTNPYDFDSTFALLPDGRFVFAANNGTNGRELWISNGTNAGTVLLRDINPGASDAFRVNHTGGFTTLGNGKVVFEADDGTSGFEPWVTDGTAVGTLRLADLVPGLGGSQLMLSHLGGTKPFLSLGNGSALFQATDAAGINRWNLWMTDGTAAGTRKVLDGLPGSPGAWGMNYALFNAPAFSTPADLTPPTLTISTSDTRLNSSEAALLTFTFSEAVTGFTASDITLSGGTIGTLSTANNILFTATFTPTAGTTSNTAGASVTANSYTDIALNNGPAASLTFTVNLLTPGAYLTGTSGDDSIAPGAISANVVGGPLTTAGDLIEGFAGNDAITAGSGPDILRGGDGDDTLNGQAGNDTLTGGIGNDVLNGGSENDQLTGGDGDDNLDGGTGTDTMTGGLGNDQYVVDALADSITENPNEGTDTVWSSVAGYTLPANIEIGRLTGTANLLIGSAGDDQLVANAAQGSNLQGGGGNDVLWGTNLVDALSGGAGDDVLRSGGGNDTLTGGPGNDQIVVLSTGAIVQENPNEGTDTLWVAVTGVTIAANIEIARLVTDNATITGNAGNDIIASGGVGNTMRGLGGADEIWSSTAAETLDGGDGDDILRGQGGADSFIGGAGNDQFVLFSAAATVTEVANGGYDVAWIGAPGWTMPGQVEVGRLIDNATSLTGSSMGENLVANQALGSTLSGMGGNDILWGSTLADTFDGGANDDIFYSYGGADRFIYRATGWGADQIAGFDRTQGMKIDFTGSGVTFANLAFVSGGGSTQVSMGSNTILVHGVSSMQQADFIFG